VLFLSQHQIIEFLCLDQLFSAVAKCVLKILQYCVCCGDCSVIKECSWFMCAGCVVLSYLVLTNAVCPTDLINVIDMILKQSTLVLFCVYY